MNHLRNFIKERILLLKEEEQASTGKDVKDTSSSKIATNKLASNPALLSAIEAIKDSQGLAAFLQDITAVAVEKGMDLEKMKSGVKKFSQAIMSAKPEDSKK